MGIGERVRLARKKRGLSQNELARQSGISFTSIRRYETGERDMKISDMQKIACILGVSLNYIILGVDYADGPQPKPLEDEIREILFDLTHRGKTIYRNLGLALLETERRADEPGQELADQIMAKHNPHCKKG